MALVHLHHPAVTATARRAASRLRAQLPFALYAGATFGAMAYLLLLTCRACG